MEGYFEFKVTFYIDEERTECGVVFGTSYADAVRRIEEAYGDDLIEFSIYAVEPLPVYVFEEKIPHRYKEK